MKPTYRFHGSLKPERRSVLAMEPKTEVEGTVATMRLYDPIDSWGDVWGVSAKEFTDAIDALPDAVTEIRLHINSPGGEVFEAVAMMNALRRHDARVVAIVDGIAASAASFLAVAADETVMSKNSTLMIHDAWGICIGNAADMRQLADLLDQLSNNIAAVYAEKAGGTVDEWRQTMVGEKWYTADEAVAAGLADSVEGSDPQPVNEFDLNIYTRDEAAEALRKVGEQAAEQAQPAASVSEWQKRRHSMNSRRRAG